MLKESRKRTEQEYGKTFDVGDGSSMEYGAMKKKQNEKEKEKKWKTKDLSLKHDGRKIRKNQFIYLT